MIPQKKNVFPLSYLEETRHEASLLDFTFYLEETRHEASLLTFTSYPARTASTICER